MNDEEAQERPRPRVVDRRISAQPSGEKATPPAAESPPTGPNEPPQQEAPPPGPDRADVPGPQSEVWTPEQEEQARRIAEEIVQTPSLEWVVNSAVTLANVAATKLDLGDPRDAQLAIDALAGLLTSVGTRLDAAEAPLRQTLAQLQLAYAQRTQPSPPGK